MNVYLGKAERRDMISSDMIGAFDAEFPLWARRILY